MSFQPGWYSTPSLGPTTFQYFQTPTLVTSQGYFDGPNQIFQWGKQQFPNGQPGQWTPDMKPLKTAGDGDWWDNPETGKVKPNNQPKPGPIANAQGIIVPQTSPNLSGSSSAPTPTAPAGKEEQGWWGSWGSAATHGVLDVIGLVPVFGEVANGVGALIYVAEGDYVSAALDAAAMWPAGGQAATAAKYGTKGAGAVVEQVEKKVARETEEALRERLAKEAREKAAREQAEKEAAEKGGKVKGDPRCILRPYKPDTCAPKTGHHVVPDRVFRVGSRGSARIPGGISEDEGLVICVTARTQAAPRNMGRSMRSTIRSSALRASPGRLSAVRRWVRSRPLARYRLRGLPDATHSRSKPNCGPITRQKGWTSTRSCVLTLQGSCRWT